MVITNTTGSIISHTTVISTAYLASPDSSGTLGIIIYFLCLKYPAGKAAKELIYLHDLQVVKYVTLKCVCINCVMFRIS